jgi:hypothetical protein
MVNATWLKSQPQAVPWLLHCILARLHYSISTQRDNEKNMKKNPIGIMPCAQRLLRANSMATLRLHA